MTDEQMAAAVVDGLAGIERCAICHEKPSQFACREKRKGTDESYAFCSGCVIKFRKINSEWNTGQAARVLRYAAFKGWLDDIIAKPGQARYLCMQVTMMNDKDFRSRWHN